MSSNPEKRLRLRQGRQNFGGREEWHSPLIARLREARFLKSSARPLTSPSNEITRSANAPPSSNNANGNGDEKHRDRFLVDLENTVREIAELAVTNWIGAHF
jgi:hypothetical protein